MVAGLSRRARIGVVLSVLWFIGGGLWGWVLATSESDWIGNLYGICLSTAYDPTTCYASCPTDTRRDSCLNQCDQRGKTEAARCQQNFSERWATQPWWENHLIMVGVVGLLPILLGWLLAWISIRVTRWVMRGTT